MVDILSPGLTITKPLTDTFQISVGNLFQGRRDSENSATPTAKKVLTVTSDQITQKEVIELILPSTENRFSVAYENSSIPYFNIDTTPPTGVIAINLILTVHDLKIGSPDLIDGKLPYFFIKLRESEKTYTVYVTWTNYWVIARILPPEAMILNHNTHEKWKFGASILSGTIPAGEEVIMEILIDDPDQMPTTLKTLNVATGDLVEGATKIGKRGVLVKFDATAGALTTGALSSKTEAWISKSSVASNKVLAVNFGEHSEKGVYSEDSEYLTVGSVGVPLKFYVDPRVTLTTKKYVYVDWYVKKAAIPLQCWDTTVSVKIDIPIENSAGTISKITPFVKVISDGDTEELLIKAKYKRTGTDRNVQGLIDTTFNTENISQDHTTTVAVKMFTDAAYPESGVINSAPYEDVGIPSFEVTINDAPSIDRVLSASSALKLVYSRDSEYTVALGQFFVKFVRVTFSPVGYILKVDTVYSGSPIGFNATPVELSFKFKDYITLGSGKTYQFYIGFESAAIASPLSPPTGYNAFTAYYKCAEVIAKTSGFVTLTNIFDNIPLLALPTENTILSYITTAGITITFDSITGKYFANGVKTSTNGKKTGRLANLASTIIGNVTGTLPVPASNISTHTGELSIKTSGNVVLTGSRVTNYKNVRIYGTPAAIEGTVDQLSLPEL